MDIHPIREGRKKPIWKRLKTKPVFFMAALLIIILISIFISTKTNAKALYTKDAENNTEECGNNIQGICLTAGCIKSSAQILSSMDFSVNPCDDFYRFVCGNYIKTTSIPDDKTSVSTFSVITDKLQDQIRRALEEPVNDDETSSIQKVKKYYQACTNKKEIERRGLRELQVLLGSLGGWPVLEIDDWDEEHFDWMQCIYLFRYFGLDTSYFFEVAVGYDLKNSSRRIIQIDQPSLGLNREFLLERSGSNLTKAYFDFMVDVAVILGAERENAISELRQSLELEKKLANFSLSKEERRNIFALYNSFKLSELERNFSSISWQSYINSLLPSNAQVTGETDVLLAVPKFVTRLEEIIRTTSKRTIANYFIWRAILSLMPFLSDQLRERELEYSEIISGLAKRPPRWQECVDEMSNSMPILVGSLYIRKYFHQEGKKNAVEMVHYIRKEFYNILKNVPWMDTVTRRAALKKAAAITEHIAYADELLDDNKLEELFNKLEIFEDKYLQSSLNIEKFTTDFQFSRLNQPVNKTDWITHGSPAQVNAFYHPIENSIVFPAGILQGHLFDKDRPRYMNYGAIGSVIGHEITHGFDDTGRQFNKDGNLEYWWAASTQQLFLEKAQCIIEQYGNYTVSEINQKLNGFNTQGENIADNGGLKEAYLAYNTWVKHNGPEPSLPGLDFTPHQLFWVSAAMNWCYVQRRESLKYLVTTDQHSPGEFRVLGPFSNQDYFARDFNCPSGTKMNPVHKCSVW